MKNFKFKNKKGFTLIETLVAIMILSLVITSVVSLMSSSIFSARYAKNEIKASYIAQEGIDYMRNLRDSIAFNKYGGGDWASFVTALKATDCMSGGCSILKLNSSPYLSLSAIAVEKSKTTQLANNEFRNIITTECVSFTGTTTCEEIKIESKVQWKNGDVAKERVLKASLIEWN